MSFNKYTTVDSTRVLNILYNDGHNIIKLVLFSTRTKNLMKGAGRGRCSDEKFCVDEISRGGVTYF